MGLLPALEMRAFLQGGRQREGLETLTGGDTQLMTNKQCILKCVICTYCLLLNVRVTFSAKGTG